MAQVFALKRVGGIPGESSQYSELELSFSQMNQQDYNILSHTFTFVEQMQDIQLNLLSINTEPDIEDDAKYCRKMIDAVEDFWLLKEKVYLDVLPLSVPQFNDWRRRFLDAGPEDRQECYRLCMNTLAGFYHWLARLQHKIMVGMLETKVLLNEQLYMLGNEEQAEDAQKEITRLSERYSLYDLDYFQGA